MGRRLALSRLGQNHEKNVLWDKESEKEGPDLDPTHHTRDGRPTVEPWQWTHGKTRVFPVGATEILW